MQCSRHNFWKSPTLLAIPGVEGWPSASGLGYNGREQLWVLKLDIVQELKDKPPILATECHVCREPTMMWLGAWARASDLKAAVAASERAGVSIINNLLDVSIAAVTERGVKRVRGTQELELEKALEPLEK